MLKDRLQKESEVLKLCKENKSTSEISQITKLSYNDIYVIRSKNKIQINTKKLSEDEKRSRLQLKHIKLAAKLLLKQTKRFKYRLHILLNKSYCRVSIRQLCPFYRKICNYLQIRPIITKCSYKSSLRDRLYHKCAQFLSNTNRSRAVNIPKSFIQEVIKKINDNPICYITGESIDLKDTSSYHFDHIIPRSRGGSNSIDNLGLTTREANMAKSDKTIDEHIEYCKKVLLNHGYTIDKLAATGTTSFSLT
jgi:5-methylcytosine-specific restriction endonuclease McrA